MQQAAQLAITGVLEAVLVGISTKTREMFLWTFYLVLYITRVKEISANGDQRVYSIYARFFLSYSIMVVSPKPDVYIDMWQSRSQLPQETDGSARFRSQHSRRIRAVTRREPLVFFYCVIRMLAVQRI